MIKKKFFYFFIFFSLTVMITALLFMKDSFYVYDLKFKELNKKINYNNFFIEKLKNKKNIIVKKLPKKYYLEIIKTKNKNKIFQIVKSLAKKNIKTYIEYKNKYFFLLTEQYETKKMLFPIIDELEKLGLGLVSIKSE